MSAMSRSLRHGYVGVVNRQTLTWRGTGGCPQHAGAGHLRDNTIARQDSISQTCPNRGCTADKLCQLSVLQCLSYGLSLWTEHKRPTMKHSIMSFADDEAASSESSSLPCSSWRRHYRAWCAGNRQRQIPAGQRSGRFGPTSAWWLRVTWQGGLQRASPCSTSREVNSGRSRDCPEQQSSSET